MKHFFSSRFIISLSAIFAMVIFLALPALGEPISFSVSSQQELIDAVTSIQSSVTAEGTIRISADFSIANSISISHGKVTLLGEGHTLTATGGGYLFNVENGAALSFGEEGAVSRSKLTINAGSSTLQGFLQLRTGSAGYIHQGVTLDGRAVNSASAVCVEKGAALTMTGGTITGSKKAQQGGGVLLSGDANSDAVFSMQGGTIENNSASIRGGGVYANHALFSMEGGTVQNNTAYNGGGGIGAEWSVFTMEGGVVQKNKTTSPQGQGGGIYCNFSTYFTLSSGEVKGNSSSSGGGIFSANSAATLMGGVIEGNRASAYGGGVFAARAQLMGTGWSDHVPPATVGSNVNDGSLQFCLAGSTIRNNNAAYGGGVCLQEEYNGHNPSELMLSRMSGGEIQGNTAVIGGGVVALRIYPNGGGSRFEMTGGSLCNNSASAYADDIYSQLVTTVLCSTEGFGKLDSTGKTIAGWYHDGTYADNANSPLRWSDEGTGTYIEEAANQIADDEVVSLKAAHGLSVLTITPKDVTGYVGGVSASGNSAPTLRFALTLDDGTAVTSLDGWTLTMHLTGGKTVASHPNETEWTMKPEKAKDSSYYLLPTLELGLESNINLTGDFLKYTHVEQTATKAGHYKIELADAQQWYITAENPRGQICRATVQPGSAQITSRYVHDDATAYQSPSSMLNKVVNDSADVQTLFTDPATGTTYRRLVAVIPDDATFYTNGMSKGLGLTGAFGHGYLEDEPTHENKPLIALLFDETVSLSSDANDEIIEYAMMQYAKAQNAAFAFDGWNYRFRYLDLVNVNDGNAWVSCDRPITIYWPYPEEVLDRVAGGEALEAVLKDYDFQIMHFSGMERENYKTWRDNITCTVETLSLTQTENGLRFVLPANPEGGNMSPFALMWKAKSTAQTYTVTYTDGVSNEEIFPDQITSGIPEGAETPSFKGTPSRDGYTFAGWIPAIAPTVTENTTYAAAWVQNIVPPQTGDYGHTLLWLSILSLSGIAMLCLLICRKRSGK